MIIYREMINLIYIQLTNYSKVSKYFHMNPNKFIIKLTEMMKQFPKIINWSLDGQEMEIVDIKSFQSEVYSKYFTTSNYKSFVRQLNMYNFKRISKRKNSASFKHSLFKKGNEALFQNIRRRRQQNKSKKSQRGSIQQRVDECNPSSLSISTIAAENELHSIIGQIKIQISQKGLSLVKHLESLLFKVALDGSDLWQASEGKQVQLQNKQWHHLRQCASLYCMEQILKQRDEFYLQSSFELEQQSKNDSHVQSIL